MVAFGVVCLGTNLAGYRKECMIGVVFSDESEAKTFYKKVTTKKTTSCALFPVSSRERVLTMYSSQI